MFVVTGETRARLLLTRSAREVLPIGRARRERVPRCDAGRTLGRVCGAWKRHRLLQVYLCKATATSSCVCLWLSLGFSTVAFT